MAAGRSNALIAGRLSVGEAAVVKHVGNIFGKLGLTSADGHRRVLAVLAYLRGDRARPRPGGHTATLSVFPSPPFDHDPGTVGTPGGGSTAAGDILVGAADAAMTRKKEGSLGGSSGPQAHP